MEELIVVAGVVYVAALFKGLTKEYGTHLFNQEGYEKYLELKIEEKARNKR